ncbi:hypothetical protein DFH09DRAFT_1090294 [Mycena vulgaris]|nr:hypothetical protein DFH09DRAFT_1090294 [Mycena vulgaris]
MSFPATGSLFWSVLTVAYTLLTVLSPVLDGTVAIVTSLSSTATVRVVLNPSRCILSQGTLQHTFMVALLYSIFTSIILVPILYQKGFFSSFASPNRGSPNPEPIPDPGAGANSSQAPLLAPRATNQIAADGAPPPPPPGNETTSDAAGRRKRSCGLFAWIWWILQQIVRFLKMLVKAPFKLVWLVVGPISYLGFKFVLIPMAALKLSNRYDITPVITSYTGPYLFWAVRSLIDCSPTTTTITFWVLRYCASAVLAQAFQMFDIIWTTVGCVFRSIWFSARSCLALIRVCVKVIRLLLVWVKASLRTVKQSLRQPMAQAMAFFSDHDLRHEPAVILFGCVVVGITLHEAFIRTRAFIPVVAHLFHRRRDVAPLLRHFAHSFPRGLELIRSRSQETLQVEYHQLLQSPQVKTMLFWWGWLVFPTVKLMSTADLLDVFAPVVVSLLVARVFQWRERASKTKSDRRLKALEARLAAIYPFLYFYFSPHRSENRSSKTIDTVTAIRRDQRGIDHGRHGRTIFGDVRDGGPRAGCLRRRPLGGSSSFFVYAPTAGGTPFHSSSTSSSTSAAFREGWSPCEDGVV